MVPERIADMELAKNKNPLRNIYQMLLNTNFRDKYLNKPSGSNGARHQLGASSRNGPSLGELNVHAYKRIIQKIIKTRTW